jgi:hypothetical protein
MESFTALHDNNLLKLMNGFHIQYISTSLIFYNIYEYRNHLHPSFLLCKDDLSTLVSFELSIVYFPIECNERNSAYIYLKPVKFFHVFQIISSDKIN